MNIDFNQKLPRMAVDSGTSLVEDLRLHNVFPETNFIRKVFILSCLLCVHLLVVEILSDIVGMSSLTYWLWRFVPYCLFLVLVAYFARPVARLDLKTLFMTLFLFSFFLTFLVGLAGRLEVFSGISILRPESSARESIFSYLRLVSMFSFLAGSYFALQEIYQTRSELSQEVERQRKTQQELKRQLGFDNLIAELLGRLAWSSASDIDSCIQTGLGQIAEFIGAEHAFVILLSVDTKTWSGSHEWCAPGIPSRMDKYQGIPMGGIRAWSEQKLQVGEVIQIVHLDDLPPEAGQIREHAEKEGVKSRLTVPFLDQGNRLIGCVGLQTYSHEQQWSQEDIRQLRLVAESFVNVLKRKEAEEALRQSENRYRTLFESAQDAIFLMREECFIDCNPHALRMFECQREQIIGETPMRFSPARQPDGLDSASKAKEKIQRAIAGIPQHFEWRHCRQDGTIFDVEVSLNRIELNEQSMLLAIVRDITERKQAEEALRESEARERQLNERFNLAADSAGLGVWDLDLVRNMLVWDERMYRLYHVTPQSFSGVYEAWQKAVHPQDLPRAQKEVQQAINSLTPFDTEFRIVWPSGEVRHIRAFARVVQDGHGFPSRMTGINYDITERKAGRGGVTR